MPPANPTTLVGLVSSIPDDQTAIIQPEQNIRISKTSMLQDWEAGRPMELEAVVGAVVELGERLGVPLPSTRAVYASRSCSMSLEGSGCWPVELRSSRYELLSEKLRSTGVAYHLAPLCRRDISFGDVEVAQ